jgi:AcrR family transcriptional regulator
VKWCSTGHSESNPSDSASTPSCTSSATTWPSVTRDDDARKRILRATRELIDERGPGQVGIDDIAERANVGKQTIYRWWRSKTALILDSLEDIAEAELRFPDTGTTREDMRLEMAQVSAAFRGPMGAVVREIIAAAQGDPAVAEALRDGLFAARRRHAREALRRGIDRGDVRADIDLEAAIDALYAPIWLRLIIGHAPLNRQTAGTIVDVVWPGLAPAG